MKKTYSLPERIRNRKHFLLAANNGRKFVAKGMIVQVIQNKYPEKKRVGFTTTKKLGCAVVRNRVRRRLREICRLMFTGVPVGYDYVFIGRQATIDRPFDMLQKDAKYIVAQIMQMMAEKEKKEQGRKLFHSDVDCLAKTDEISESLPDNLIADAQSGE